MNVHALYILELKTSKKKFPPVRLSARPSVCMSVSVSVCLLGRLKNLSGCKITFIRVSASKQNLVHVFYV